MTFVDPQSNSIAALAARSSDLTSTEYIWLWFAEKLTHRPYPDKMVDKIWHRHEATWKKLPLSVI